MSEIENYEKEYLIRWEREERYKEEWLGVVEELIDQREAETKLQNQLGLFPQRTINISSEGQVKSRKEIFEEYEKKYLDWVEAESKKSAEMRRKTGEIVAKRLSESQPQTIILESQI